MMSINKNVYLSKMESSVYGREKSENNFNNSDSTGAFRTDDNHIMPIVLIKEDWRLFELHSRKYHLSVNLDVKK